MLTVNCRPLRENLEAVKVLDSNVIRSIYNPHSPTGGIAILKGNLAPDGAVVKQSAVDPSMAQNKGKARVFESEESAVEAIMAGGILPAI